MPHLCVERTKQLLLLEGQFVNNQNDKYVFPCSCLGAFPELMIEGRQPELQSALVSGLEEAFSLALWSEHL